MSKFEKLSDHIWIMHAEHGTDRPVLAAVAGERRTLLMDAGNSAAHAALFREELLGQGVRLPELMVLTHWHWDHTFGMSAWGIPAIAHEETTRALEKLSGVEGWSDAALDRLIAEGYASESTVRNIKAEYGEDLSSIRIAMPDIRFRDAVAVDLGGVTCRLEHVGGDHSSDCSFLYVEEDRVLFTGDALGPSVYGGPRTYTPGNFLRLIDRVDQYEADVIVESHGEPMTRDAFDEDVKPWVSLARLAEQYGADKSRLLEELERSLPPEPAPDGGLRQAVDWFVNGLTRS